MELYRKTLQKILQYESVDLSPWGPRTVLKQTYTYGYLSNLTLITELLDDRNIFSHEYNKLKTIELVDEIDTHIPNSYNT